MTEISKSIRNLKLLAEVTGITIKICSMAIFWFVAKPIAKRVVSREVWASRILAWFDRFEEIKSIIKN